MDPDPWLIIVMSWGPEELTLQPCRVQRDHLWGQNFCSLYPEWVNHKKKYVQQPFGTGENKGVEEKKKEGERKKENIASKMG